MKRITTFFFLLLFALTLQGQKALTYDGKVLTYDGKVLIQNYVPESEAIFAAMGTIPSDARKRLIDNLVRGLKDDGIWDILDWLDVYAAHAENSSLLNWINPGTFDATNVHSTAFEVDRGYTGDGANDYLTAGGWIPSVDGINYTQNSASMFLYNRTDIASIGTIGINNTTQVENNMYILPRYTSDVAYIKNNNNNSDNDANIDGSGMFINSRTGVNSTILYRNKIAIITSATASVGLPTRTPYCLCLNDNGVADKFRADQVAAYGFGGGMTQTQVTNFTNRIETFMDAIGAGVISEMMWLILLLIPNVRRKEHFKIAA